MGTGSAIAHRAVDAVMGPRTVVHEHAGAPAETASARPLAAQGEVCFNQKKAFSDVRCHPRVTRTMLSLDRRIWGLLAHILHACIAHRGFHIGKRTHDFSANRELVDLQCRLQTADGCRFTPQCLENSGGDIARCQFYFDALEQWCARCRALCLDGKLFSLPLVSLFPCVLDTHCRGCAVYQLHSSRVFLLCVQQEAGLLEARGGRAKGAGAGAAGLCNNAAGCF